MPFERDLTLQNVPLSKQEKKRKEYVGYRHEIESVHSVLITVVRDATLDLYLLKEVGSRGSQNKQASKRSPKLKMGMLLEVFDTICPPQELTSVGHCHYKKWSYRVDY